MDNYLGEVKLWPYNWAPKGWALCNGALLSITQNQALFSLIGTTYGGDGRTTFALPDLRGRAAMHMSSTYPIGVSAGQEAVTLNVTQIPTHTHMLMCSNEAGNTADFTDAVISGTTGTAANLYGAAEELVPLNTNVIGMAGGAQPHENCQPSLVLNYCIAITGAYPSRN